MPVTQLQPHTWRQHLRGRRSARRKEFASPSDSGEERPHPPREVRHLHERELSYLSCIFGSLCYSCLAYISTYTQPLYPFPDLLFCLSPNTVEQPQHFPPFFYRLSFLTGLSVFLGQGFLCLCSQPHPQHSVHSSRSINIVGMKFSYPLKVKW